MTINLYLRLTFYQAKPPNVKPFMRYLKQKMEVMRARASCQFSKEYVAPTFNFCNTWLINDQISLFYDHFQIT